MPSLRAESSSQKYLLDVGEVQNLPPDGLRQGRPGVDEPSQFRIIGKRKR